MENFQKLGSRSTKILAKSVIWVVNRIELYELGIFAIVKKMMRV